jgi:hypothetical protein
MELVFLFGGRQASPGHFGSLIEDKKGFVRRVFQEEKQTIFE